MTKYFKQQIKKYKWLYLFLIPAVVLALMFSYFPMVGLLMAFKGEMDLVLLTPIEAFMQAEWTMEHFQKIFSDAEILHFIVNTLIISFLKIVLLFPLPIILAVMVADVKGKGFSTFVQSMVFLPHFLSWVAITGIFKSLLAVDGPINELLGINTNWFARSDLFRGLVVVLSGWKEVGYSSIVYISAILSIDVSLYEAAKLDGASKFRQAVKITIPMIASTIMVMFIIRMGYLMEGGFEQIQTMISSTTRKTGEILGTYTYRISLGENAGQYGLSTAVGLFNGVISLLLICSTNAISKKVTQEGIW